MHNEFSCLVNVRHHAKRVTLLWVRLGIGEQPLPYNIVFFESLYTNAISNSTYTHHQLVLQPIQLEHQMFLPH